MGKTKHLSIRVTYGQLKLLVGLLGDEVCTPRPTTSVGRMEREKLEALLTECDELLSVLTPN